MLYSDTVGYHCFRGPCFLCLLEDGGSMRGGKLKKRERWRVYDQTIEVTEETNCPGVTLKYSGRRNKQKAKIIAKSNQTPATIDKCSVRKCL